MHVCFIKYKKIGDRDELSVRKIMSFSLIFKGVCLIFYMMTEAVTGSHIVNNVHCTGCTKKEITEIILVL
jgi:hypothetical protein